MTSKSNNSGFLFADIVNKFIINEDKYIDGYEARVVNMFIRKEDGIITVRNPTAKIVMVITPKEDDGFEFQMRFANATTYTRLMAVKEMLQWDGFNVIFEGGIPFLLTNKQIRVTLNSGLLYSKTELEEMSNQ